MRLSVALIGAAAAALLAAASTANAAEPVDFAFGGGVRVAVTSMKAEKFAATTRQRYDFSCGSAALATLLTYHYGVPTSEEATFNAMYAVGDAEKIRREGFSLLDIKRYLGSLGFDADGFELPLESLLEARIPALVLLSENGFNHFVVVKGVRDGRVLLGDPSSGTRAITRQRFEALWTNRILFVIRNRQDVASFNTSADWQASPASPLSEGVVRDSLTNIVLPRMGPGDI